MNEKSSISIHLFPLAQHFTSQTCVLCKSTPLLNLLEIWFQINVHICPLPLLSIHYFNILQTTLFSCLRNSVQFNSLPSWTFIVVLVLLSQLHSTFMPFTARTSPAKPNLAIVSLSRLPSPSGKICNGIMSTLHQSLSQVSNFELLENVRKGLFKLSAVPAALQCNGCAHCIGIKVRCDSKMTTWTWLLQVSL